MLRCGRLTGTRYQFGKALVLDPGTKKHYTSWNIQQREIFLCKYQVIQQMERMSATDLLLSILSMFSLQTEISFILSIHSSSWQGQSNIPVCLISQNEFIRVLETKYIYIILYILYILYTAYLSLCTWLEAIPPLSRSFCRKWICPAN